MPTKIQYSPQPELVPFFQRYGFTYSLQNATGEIITTVNKFRKYLEEILGIARPSRNTIQRLLHETHGKIIGTALNAYGHISQICLINIDRVRMRVQNILKESELITTKINNHNLEITPQHSPQTI